MIETIAELQQFSAVDLSGLSAVSVFFALFLATFISEDAACLAAGVLAANGEISFVFAVAACFSGIVAGDIGLYWIGRTFGTRILGLRFARRMVTRQSLSRASRWLEKRGASAVFLSRFVTGLRLPTYLAAGFLKTDFPRFTIYFLIAAAIWTPILVGSVAASDQFFDGSVLLAAAVVFVTVRIGLKLVHWRNRRLALGRMKRILRWEFWPLAVFYFPVVCYVFLLALKHRSLTVFTCANPAIPSGGFAGESKDEIYSLLSAAEENGCYLLRHCLIDGALSPDAKFCSARQFLKTNDLSFPAVVKPNAGERGKDVRIVYSDEALCRALEDSQGAQIIQEYFGGHEVSIFYYRYPGSEKGVIFSMTEKLFPSVTGDGFSTLEELILRDGRAVCIADKYLSENADRLRSVPGAGEIVTLIDLGTHSRGAIFLDGSHLRTPALENAIDAICRRVEGFNFGRFDIRFSAHEDFLAGRNFKIIELNGVTSESTNIYDPGYSLVDAYRILSRQWRLAFEIGAENHRLGAKRTRWQALFREAWGAIVAGLA
ncbi:MAG TPA: VTT domain-containing protein [Pyrinomonadaceae bacterium]